LLNYFDATEHISFNKLQLAFFGFCLSNLPSKYLNQQKLDIFN